jgi:alcohol dehydrogenase
MKMACGDKRAAFRVALLDPELTTTQPSRVTALTGFDALAHAVETAVTKARTPLSQAFSREAWVHLAPNFLRVIAEPDNLAARGEMQLGACLAGLAIENSMLGAAHAAANPLTATYGITHGDAVALMLPHVVRHNGAVAESEYHDLVLATAFDKNTPDQRAGAAGLAHFLGEAAAAAGLATQLRDHGVDQEQLPQLAADAMKQWTGSFNPVAMSAADYEELYEAAY